MKEQVSKHFCNIQNDINKIYNKTQELIKENEKIDKKYMKKVRKRVDINLQSIENNVKFFDQFNDNQITKIFLFESINELKELIVIPMWISYLEFIDIKLLVKDKDFLLFLKQHMIMDMIYRIKKRDENFDTSTEYLNNLKLYFGDIRSILLSYFLIKEKNLTKIKIQNITSFILKNADIRNTSILQENKQCILTQLVTGTKYEKLKESINNTTYSRTNAKSNKFNILEKVKNTIRIKYISTQEYKHRFHKSPKEHERIGHYRYYKNGTKVWINSTIINNGNVA